MLDMKSIRAEAQNMLGSKGNRVRVIIAISLWIFAVFSPMMLGSDLAIVFFGFGEEMNESQLLFSELFYFGVWSILTVTVSFPAIAMIYRYVWRCYARTRGISDGYVKDLGYGYLRCLGGGALICLRPILVFLLFLGAYTLAGFFEYILYLPLMFMAVVLSFFLMWGTGSAFLVPYYFCRGYSGIRAFSKSRKTMKKNWKIYGAYMWIFMGWVFLSLLTAGVLLIFYTVPLMMFTYFTLAERLDGKRQEEIQ